MMFGSATDGDSAVSAHRTEDGCIVGFGAAARKDNFTWRAPKHVSNVVARFVDCPARRTRETVAARRVGELIVQERAHRLDCLAAHRRCCGVIEVRQRCRTRIHSAVETTSQASSRFVVNLK
jgi:hypothetical protein